MERRIRIPKWVCDIYLRELNFINFMPAGDIGMEDGNLSNTIYHSKRSAMDYCYLVSHLVLFLNACIILYVRWKTGIRLNAEINKRCAPIFSYGIRGECKVHRDRDMLNGKANYPEYVAVLCLSDRHVGGKLFVNSSPYNQVGDDGKEVREDRANRRYHRLHKGEMLIFSNRDSVHGVSPVLAGTRITTGFRSL